MTAPPDAREKMLQDLQKFAFTGIPDFRDVPKISQVNICKIASEVLLIVIKNKYQIH